MSVVKTYALYVMIALLTAVPTVVRAEELALTLTKGIDPKRPFDQAERWVSPLIRLIPPDEAPYTLVASGPVAWTQGVRPPNVEVEKLNERDAAILVSELQRNGLADAGDSALAAGRVVALLRPLEPGGARVPARYQALMPLWEVLAFPRDADTLSCAVAAVQVLDRLGVAARIAKYPAVDGSLKFGVEVQRPPLPTLEKRNWGVDLKGGRFLAPIARSARPHSVLLPDEVQTWALQEVLAPAWQGGGTPEIRPAAKLDVVDPCLEAESLGFECVSTDTASQRFETLVVFTSVAGGLLLILFGQQYCRWRERRQRALARKEAQKRGEF